MGSSHELPSSKKKRRNSDCISNYVDRVRICDTKSIASESVYSKASSQKSGWRQKSYSSIDLSTSSDYQPGAGAFRYCDFEAQDDICLKNIKNSKNKEIQRDYEDIYNVNPKAQGHKREIIKEHNKIHQDRRDNDVCSLRRSKSLAVIREETYNDLSIAGPKTRRSQLIPRAKLIDRNFFKDRLSFALEEGLSFSLDSNLQSDIGKNNTANTTTGNNNSSSNGNNYYSWNCDKSDLGSIDSNFFKNSLHQSALQEKSSTLKTDSTKIVSRAEIHNENNGTVSASANKSEINRNDNESSVNINEDTESGITIIEIKDRKQLVHGPTSSVISYDSIYLSSESDKQTVLNETFDIEDIDSKIKDFEKIIKELNLIGDNDNKSDSIIDNLYSQVAKGVGSSSLLDVTAVEPKIHADTLSKCSDYISKGTLERLTILSGLSGTNKIEKEKSKKSRDRNNNSSKSEFQYSSLPDVGISKLLRDCELIDAKLRDDVSIELLEPYPDYDLGSNEVNLSGNSNNNINSESTGGSDKNQNLNEPISLDEENPKGAPSIELVQLPTRELDDDTTNKGIIDGERANRNTTKIYLPELGLELDYENSIVSFESDLDLESPTPDECFKPQSFNLVTISGRKVIVDELAAKTEHKRDQEQIARDKKKVSEDEGALSNNTGIKNVDNKINGTDNRRLNIADKRERKIKLPECTQPLVDCTTDKEIVFRKNSLAAAKKEEENISIQSDCESGDSRSSKKDLTTFCILQKNNHHTDKRMPRPQLLNIVDSKNSTPKNHQQLPQQQRRINNKTSDGRANAMAMEHRASSEMTLNETEKEFFHKVDSVRNYWSRMLDSDGDIKKRNNLQTMSKVFSSSKSSGDIPQSLRNEDFQSFFPTVEIIELNDGETQAALVTARKLNDVEFDHVRYKVMKSEMFQKNLAKNNNRKETQFDGLMQYLQDYSFQELLANNNVIVIEPVRTKIEKVSEKPNKAQSAACKITNGAAGLNRSGSNNLKKHFFYHPIRVNKELYEDELPAPETVRNVRKLFEESLRMGNSTSKLSDNSSISKSSDNLKARKTIRYLTIDTSFENNLATSKWDSISLSSGVSSAADLSSPCECHENPNRNAVCSSKETLDNSGDDNDDDSRSHFASSDVLEKIQECESSISFYGAGGVATSINENERINPDLMTKVSTREVGGQKCNCQGRNSNRGIMSNERHHPKRHLAHDYTGLKFKLVKSNSCSSRLELTGTGNEINALEEMKNIVHGQREQSFDEEDLEQEETVKDMIYKLETRNFAPTKPRIIESKCIEKVSPDAKVTINNQSLEKVKLDTSSLSGGVALNIDSSNENVTVNNHISVLNSKLNNQDENVAAAPKPKIVRNKNVDLALAAINKSKMRENAKTPRGFNSESSDDAELLVQNESHSDSRNVCRMQSVEMVKMQDKINNAQLKNSNNHTHSVGEAPAQKSILSSGDGTEEKPPKMVNWGTVGIITKEFIANDNKLIHVKPYDEMEFEEFEVAGEQHYDSLNSK